VPEVQLAYPGQPVRIVVSTTKTASEFRNATVRILYPATCHYKASSFNIGAPGGTRWAVDGVWSLTDALNFIDPPGDFPEVQIDAGHNAIDVPLTSDATTGAVGASGALFNFELVAGGDAAFSFSRGSLAQPLTAYFDAAGDAHFWSSDSNAGQPGIQVQGVRPVLSLVSPPPGDGAGTAGSPYLLETPADFQLALLSEGSDVSTSPDTSWTAVGSDVTISDTGALHIGSGFHGLLIVTGTYRGLPNTNDSTLYIYVGQPLFSAQIDSAATFTNGGGGLGSFSTIVLDHGATLDVQVLGSDVSGLKALYFDMPFDQAKYRYDSFDGISAFEDADATNPVITPSAGLPMPVLLDTDNKAHLRFGMAMAIPPPDQTEGYSGGGPLVTLHFSLAPGGYQLRSYLPPTGSNNKATIKQSLTKIQWDYYNAGDTNQNGTVEYNDFNPIAKRFGVPPPPDGTTDDVIDCNNDNFINLLDAQTVESTIDNRVEVYHVYGGTWPDGQIVEVVPFSAAKGQGQGIRLYFEHDVNLDPTPYPNYWVKPVAGGQEGVTSNVCFYIPPE
jgi:hypothetical protein